MYSSTEIYDITYKDWISLEIPEHKQLNGS